jgi:hypothetical protein
LEQYTDGSRIGWVEIRNPWLDLCDGRYTRDVATDESVNRQLTHETDIRKWWPFVRDGLQRVQRHCVDDWIPEDVYASLIAGQSFLFIGQGKEPEIAIVVSPAQSYGGLYWHVWTTAGERHDDYLPLLEEHARRAGARRLTFFSPRRGWARKGWALKQYHYERLL